MPLPYLFLLLPIVGAAFVYRAGYNNYTLLLYLTLAFIFLVVLMTIVRSRRRDAMLVLAAIMFCLVGIDAYEVFSE
ncbi:MAG: hypothetical protein NVSMB26_28910 [Beijerinckiaceae bacterium]